MNELQPFLDVLTAKYGWLSAMAGWIASARLVLKPIQTVVTAGLDALIAKVASTASKDDDALLEKLFASKAWNWTALAADIFLSIKLPTSTTKQNTPQCENSPTTN